MSVLVITGRERLNGTISVSGSKNAALPILAAAILVNGKSTICNVPRLMDIAVMIKVLRYLGLRTEYTDEKQVVIWNTKPLKHVAPYELVTRMRASFFVAGPILAKTGLARVPLPGGCAIGSRPVDIHLKGFKALGATSQFEHGFVELRAKKLKGARISLDFPSVGATENIMMAAVLAEGSTILENVAREPEIIDVANFLNAAGAKIRGAGTDRIEIQGVRSLSAVEYTVIPDRIEAGTLMVAAGITDSAITLSGVNMTHLEPLISKLNETGLTITHDNSQLTVHPNGDIMPLIFETMPFPGFPTDMQAQMMALMSMARGTSIIKENVFESRFSHAHELNRMGANIRIEHQSAIVCGVDRLSGAPVKVTDLRAGAALLLAGIAAEGQTIVYGVHHIHRGYEQLPEKLIALGANIQYSESQSSP